MDSLLTLLPLLTRRQQLRRPIVEFSSTTGWKAVVREAAKELVAALVALFLVIAFLAFFFLYCLP